MTNDRGINEDNSGTVVTHCYIRLRGVKGRGPENILHGRLKMETSFATSIWDNKPIFELEYKRQKHSLGRLQMRDEVSREML